MKLYSRIGAAVALAGVASIAPAQDYPSRAVRIVAPPRAVRPTC